MQILKANPVLIVGAGPTGMTAALELARFRIPVRLVEKTPEPATTSRAVGVQARTLELFEQRGLAEKLLPLGNPGVAGSIYGGGKRVFRLEFCHVDSRYGYIFFVSQAETERILREALARENVTIERPVEMIAFAQAEPDHHTGRSGGVTATLCQADGSLEEVAASYLISAEGAHSVVRSSLGLQFQGKTLDEEYALGDLHIDGDLPATDFHIFSSEHGFMGLFPLGKDRFRLIGSNPLSKPSKDTEPSLEELQKIYDMRSHIPARFHDLTWSSWFRINSRMIDHLRRGSIFLGGDSAHIHSPAGAQGMNTGIQDMINLAWKIAFVLRGDASPKLLDTYADDRLPVIRHVLTKTEGLTDIIGAENPIFRTVFEHLGPLIVGTEFVQEKSTTRMSQIGLHYRESSLSENHGHGGGSLHAGDRIPDLDLLVLNQPGTTRRAPRRARLFSLLNPSKFTLFYVNVDDATDLHGQVQSKLASWHSFIDGHQIAPVEDETGKKHFVENLGKSPALVLVRPDSYAGFIGRDEHLPQLAAYLQKWLPQKAKTNDR